MLQPDFADILWKKQKEYIEGINSPSYFSRFKAFRNVFNCFWNGETVAQIACGGINEDLFLTMDKVGKKGKIILIDKEPSFVYDRALNILGGKNLPEGKEFYTETERGKQFLRELFSQANIEAHVQHLPPYPEQIKDYSLDHVMAINAAFELMGQRPGGPPGDVKGLVAETHRKLKKDGSFLVQGLESFDIHAFGSAVWEAERQNGITFEQDYGISELLIYYGPGTGHWARWIKRE